MKKFYTVRFWVSLITMFLFFSGRGAIRGVITGRKQQCLLEAATQWADYLLKINGVKVNISGLENIKPNQTYILASNHQSVIDILVLAAALKIPFTFAVKKSLFRVPLFGHYMKSAGYLSMDRKNPKKDYLEITKSLKNNRFSLLIFPEGTRSDDGQLRPFKSGVSIIAKQTGLPTIPITVSGTIKIMTKGDKSFRPGTAKVTVGEPIEWNDNKTAFINELKESIQRALS